MALWKVKKFINQDPESFFELENGDLTGDLGVYEPHGGFKVKNLWIVYGHEEINVYDEYGTLITSEHTR